MLKILLSLQTKTICHVTKKTGVKWVKQDINVIMCGQSACPEVFTSSSEKTEIWLYFGKMACPFRPTSAHVVDPTGESVGTKPASRQGSFQLPVVPNSVEDNDQQPLNLKHLSEAIKTLTSPPVSPFSSGNLFFSSYLYCEICLCVLKVLSHYTLSGW